MQNFPLAGGTMAGGIAMGTNKVQAWVIPLRSKMRQQRHMLISKFGLSPVLTIAGDVGANDTVTVGTDNLTIAGGTNIESTITNNTVTLNLTGTVNVLTSFPLQMPKCYKCPNADKINIQTSSDATACIM